MKIAYFGVYRDGTGYANAAIGNILSCDAVGLDVVCRPVNLSAGKVAKQCGVEHLEAKNLNDVDVVIQHILPHFFEYKRGVKNIGMFEWETTNFCQSNWSVYCNMMDEIWVPSYQNKQAAINSGVTKPIKIIPHACDPERFSTRLDPLNIPALKGHLVFYVVAEMTRRKNFATILRAYLSTFTQRDNVCMVLKTNIPGKSPDQSQIALKQLVSDIKRSIHIYKDQSQYPEVMAITDHLTSEQLDRLHVSCDVFVLPSRGEAWALPAHDAMGFGNPVILSNWGSFPDLTHGKSHMLWIEDTNTFGKSLDIQCGWLVDGQLTSCFGMVENEPYLYTGKEMWFDPDIGDLSRKMREAHSQWSDGSLLEKGAAAKDRALQFSYDKVGKIIANALKG